MKLRSIKSLRYICFCSSILDNENSKNSIKEFVKNDYPEICNSKAQSYFIVPNRPGVLKNLNPKFYMTLK